MGGYSVITMSNFGFRFSRSTTTISRLYGPRPREPEAFQSSQFRGVSFVSFVTSTNSSLQVPPPLHSNTLVCFRGLASKSAEPHSAITANEACPDEAASISVNVKAREDPELSAAKEERAAAKAKLEAAEEERAAAKAKLEAAEAKLEAAEEELKAAYDSENQNRILRFQTERDAAQKHIDSAQKQIDLAQKQIDSALMQLQLASTALAPPGEFASGGREAMGTAESLKEFDLQSLRLLELRMVDYSAGFNTFRGRDKFAEKLAAEVRSLLRTLTVTSRGTAFVFSTSAGIGKTRGQLELKRTLPGLVGEDERIDETLFGYAGFNSGLDLSSEERNIVERGITYAENVLARRVLGSVVASGMTDVATELPKFSDLYEGRTIPEASTSIAQLVQYVSERKNDENKYTVVVVGIDEVQLLDRTPVKHEDGGAGRIFLRILRRWQVKLFWESNILLVPVGTGITVDFPFNVTTGTNRAIYEDGGDGTIFPTKDAFRQLVAETYDSLRVTEDPYDQTPNDRVIDAATATWWPRVRMIENWAKGEAIIYTPDSNEEAWKEWHFRWMVDESISARDASLIPGRSEGSMIGALFQIDNLGYTFKVIPDCANAIPMMDQLGKGQGRQAKRIYKNLASSFARPEQALCSVASMTFDDFERYGFKVATASLLEGGKALCEKPFTQPEISKPDTTKQKCRLRLALLLDDMVPDLFCCSQGPDIIDNPSGSYFPFANSDQTTFLPAEARRLREAYEKKQPVYFHTGRQTKCDYLFLFPKDDGKWVALIGDAKFASSGDTKIHDPARQQVVDAKDMLSAALAAEGFTLSDFRLFLLTNQYHSGSWGEISYSEDFIPKNGLAATKIHYLDADSFDFAPFTDILFRGSWSLRDEDGNDTLP